MRVAVLKGGRSLERQVSLKSGARVEDALERLGHEVVPIDVGADLVDAADATPRPSRVRRAARPRRRGRHRAGAARGDGHPVHRLGRVGLHPRRGQGAGQARDARRRHPDAGLLRLQRDRVQGARRRRRRCRRSRSGSSSRSWSSRRAQGSALGHQVRAHAGRRARRRWSRRSRTTARCCSSATSPGRDLAVSIIEDDGAAAALPIVEAVPERGGLLRLRGPLRDRAHALRVPGRARRRGRPARAQRARARGLRAARLRGLRARRPDARARTGELYVLEANRSRG